MDYVTKLSYTSKATSFSTSVMADMDVFAAMGISGFGKATVKKRLDPSRFDKNKREEVSLTAF